ncbi:MAG: hypothetical protein ABIU09_07230 [Pyrinomonadaceae bacterium]
MRNILLLILVAAMALSGIACGGGSGSGANNAATPEKVCAAISDTPTAAYKRLFAAVKTKNTETIKAEMSKKTQEFAESLAARQKNTVDKVYVNGFTSTTFAETLPEMRDERVVGCWGAVEVRNDKDQIWEDLPFANEDGMWKFAVGEMFGGSFKTPGKSQGTKEREAANSSNGQPPPSRTTYGNTNANSNTAASPKYDGPQVEPMPKR